MVCNYNQYQSKTSLVSPHWYIRRMESIFAMLFTYGKAGELQILRCQRIAVGSYSFTFDALTLKPSGF